MDQSYNTLLKTILPESISEYFTLTELKKDDQKEVMDLYLQEVNTVPVEYSNAKLSSKGFFDEVTIQDFGSGSKVVDFNFFIGDSSVS